jgi:hypothetical protein
MKKIFILFCLISISLCGRNIRTIVRRIVSDIPRMEAEIRKAPVGRTSKIHPILSQGYLKYTQILEVIYNPGIMTDYINEFLNDCVSGYFDIKDKNIKKKLLSLLQFAEFSKFNQVLMPKSYFKAGSANSFGSFLITLTENVGDSVDFLFLNIKATYLYTPEYFIGEKADENILWGSSSQILIERPKDLTIKELDNLFNFLQIAIFKAADKIMNVIDSWK